MNYINSNSPIKNVVAIHDLSSFGRCSLTVIIPTLSVMGFQVTPLPTAILSTHTGGFSDFTFLDLTDKMEQMYQHWQTLNIKFDAIYTGFLGSEDQINTVLDFINQFKTKNNILLVDPVMGDDGKLYSTYTTNMQKRIIEIVHKADIITPNITEAFFLLNMPYHTQTRELVSRMLYKLTNLGPKKVVITGIHINDGGQDTLGSACLNLADKQDNEPSFYMKESINKSYPGTGDLFSSVLLGKLLNGDDLKIATEFATNFVHKVIFDTSKYNIPERNGVLLEKFLYKLHQ